MDCVSEDAEWRRRDIGRWCMCMMLGLAVVRSCNISMWGSLDEVNYVS
jgi:hypothetical protein